MVPLTVLACAVVMMAIEALSPGRRWPSVAGWWARAFALNGVQAGMVFVSGWAWDPWLRAHRPWSTDALGPICAGLIGYLALTFVYYWWHRARHEVPALWRWFHQLHHSRPSPDTRRNPSSNCCTSRLRCRLRLRSASAGDHRRRR